MTMEPVKHKDYTKIRVVRNRNGDTNFKWLVMIPMPEHGKAYHEFHFSDYADAIAAAFGFVKPIATTINADIVHLSGQLIAKDQSRWWTILSKAKALTPWWTR